VIETRLFSLWDGLVGSVALIAIIVLALCVMVGAVKREDVLRHLGVIVGIVILLIMLPAIIVSLWNSMTLGQHVGIVMVGIVIVVLYGAFRQLPRNVGRR
jgi:uncharacterized membrane protein YoaK (UPF0700 family)